VGTTLTPSRSFSPRLQNLWFSGILYSIVLFHYRTEQRSLIKYNLILKPFKLISSTSSLCTGPETRVDPFPDEMLPHNATFCDWLGRKSFIIHHHHHIHTYNATQYISHAQYSMAPLSLSNHVASTSVPYGWRNDLTPNPRTNGNLNNIIDGRTRSTPTGLFNQRFNLSKRITSSFIRQLNLFLSLFLFLCIEFLVRLVIFDCDGESKLSY